MGTFMYFSNFRKPYNYICAYKKKHLKKPGVTCNAVNLKMNGGVLSIGLSLQPRCEPPMLFQNNLEKRKINGADKKKSFFFTFSRDSIVVLKDYRI